MTTKAKQVISVLSDRRARTARRIIQKIREGRVGRRGRWVVEGLTANQLVLLRRVARVVELVRKAA
jgi:hypothetical protein